MSPEERQMLTELFDRVRGQANAPRDPDAENLIADAVRAQPYAPYLLAQAVIVQEHALRAADQKMQALQAEVSRLQTQAQPQSSSGGFLGGLFGGGSSRPAPEPGAGPNAGPNPWGAAPQQSYAPPPPPPPQAAASPWGAPQPQQQGGGFLRNALGAAAGVAGGVLLADSIRGLFSGGHNASLFGGGFGGSGLGAGGFGSGGLGSSGGETIVNNYYDSPGGGQNQGLFDASDDNSQDSSDADFSGDDDFGGDDFSSDV